MKPTQSKLRIIIIWIVSLILCLSAGSTVVNLWARRGVVYERERDLQSLKKENRELEGALAEISGEAYVERIARDKLGMVREGETIVIMPSQESIGEQKVAGEDVPNWRKWWRLFF